MFPNYFSTNRINSDPEFLPYWEGMGFFFSLEYMCMWETAHVRYNFSPKTRTYPALSCFVATGGWGLTMCGSVYSKTFDRFTNLVCVYFSWYFTATDLKTVYLSQAMALWAFCSFGSYLLLIFIVQLFSSSYCFTSPPNAYHLSRLSSFWSYVTITTTTIIFHRSWFLALFCQCMYALKNHLSSSSSH